MSGIVLNIGSLCGIYAIVHTETGRAYVGSSKSIKHRIWAHQSGLRRGKHFNQHLQNAFKKHGETAFHCEILQVCGESDLLKTETEWIRRKGTDSRSHGYNLMSDAMRHTPSEETRQRMSDSSPAKGKPAYNRGVPHSNETRRRISEAGKGRIKTSETCEKLRQAMLSESHPHRGKALSDETRVRMSAAKHMEPPRHGKFKGVSFDKRTKTYQSKIYANSVHVFLGRYKTDIEAAAAYNNAATMIYGDTCFLNNVAQCVPVRRTLRGRIPADG